MNFPHTTPACMQATSGDDPVTSPSDIAVSRANVLSHEKWAKRITDAWQKQVSSIFKVGSLLEAAKAELKHGKWIAMIKGDLPFGRSTANKLMKIAACDYLRNAEHVPHLPAHWGTLFELTTLTEEQFERGIESGAINTKMQRKHVKALRGDAPKLVKPGPRRSVAELSEENARLKAEMAQLKAHIAESEATRAKELAGANGPTLLWLAPDHTRDLGYFQIQARTAGGAYVIIPRFEPAKRGRPFIGYDVQFVTIQRDDPEAIEHLDWAEDTDIRIIKSGVQSKTEARTIAQADADQRVAETRVTAVPAAKATRS
jgi:hypothetical protein